ncbi:MAG: hypothetical protein ACR2JE_10825 [Acidobacteriaceae bacterium]
MSREEWQEPQLKQDTQKEQNAFFTPKDARTPGEEQGGTRPVNLSGELPRETAEPGAPEELYEGRQSGGSRAEHAAYADAGSEGHRKVEPEQEAHEGSLRTRAPQGEEQGISNASSSEEAESQRRVVSERPDARAGINPANRKAS